MSTLGWPPLPPASDVLYGWPLIGIAIIFVFQKQLLLALVSVWKIIRVQVEELCEEIMQFLDTLENTFVT